MTNKVYKVSSEEEFGIHSVLNAIFDNLTGQQVVELKDMLINNNMKDNAPAYLFDRVIQSASKHGSRRSTYTAYGKPNYEN